MRRAAFVLLLVPLATAACGGSKSKTAVSVSPLEAVRSAAQKTEQSGSAHLNLTATVVAGGQNVSLRGSGAYDVKAHDGSLDATFDAGAISGAIQEVQQGTDVYLKSDLFSVALPAGKTWVKLDLAKAAKSRGLNLQALLAEDPSASLKALQALRGVTKIGTEQVGGVATTHYRAQIDTTKLSGASGLPGGGTYDVWIGDDGYIHRVQTVVSAGKTASGRVRATVTTDLSGYGTKVNVKVPPSGETYATRGGSIPGFGG
jgi:LppX/LprAFG-like lipoprotein